MKRCRGCGAVLQTEDRTLPGYTPKAENDYCQRCFRLIHYDDLTVSMRTGIDPDLVLEEIRRLDALVLWVVDLFDFLLSDQLPDPLSARQNKPTRSARPLPEQKGSAAR